MGYHYEKLMNHIQNIQSHFERHGNCYHFVVCNYLFGILTLVDSKRFDTPIYVTLVILLFF